LHAHALQEPLRWIADVVVMEAFESRVLDLPDFYFTGDDYRYRFEPEAKQRFLDVFRERFNSGIRHRGRAFKWDTVIRFKVQELANYVVGKRTNLDFGEPKPVLSKTDSEVIKMEYYL
jgi:hypothetical protein